MTFCDQYCIVFNYHNFGQCYIQLHDQLSRSYQPVGIAIIIISMPRGVAQENEENESTNCYPRNCHYKPVESLDCTSFIIEQLLQ